MPFPIDSAQAKAMGIETSHERMENGETRHRLLARGRSSYARTDAGSQGSWQRAHVHRSCMETYTIESGSVLFAYRENDTVRYIVLEAGQSHTFASGTAHNVYMPPFAVTHTVKYGGDPDSDWFADEALTELTHAIDPNTYPQEG